MKSKAKEKDEREETLVPSRATRMHASVCNEARR